MNVDLIRAAFIRTHLDRAQRHLEDPSAIRTAREFRTYLNWHAGTLPEPERKSISQQLIELECNLSFITHREP
jgi:hypothetical protein